MRKVLLAVGPAVALVFAVRLVNPTAPVPRWPAGAAEARFRETAQQMGWDSSGMTPESSVDARDPAVPRLVLTATKRGSSMRAEYSPDGRLLTWDCRRCSARAGSAATEQQVLQALAGGHASDFKLKERDQEEGTSDWEWLQGGQKAHLAITDGAASKASVGPLQGAARARRWGGGTLRLFEGLHQGVFWTALAIAAAMALRAFFRWREARRVASAVALFWLLAFLAVALAERGPAGREGYGYHLFGHPLLWALPCVAGLKLIRGHQIGAWLGFLHAAERWRPAGRTGLELWNGLLWGWPLALASIATVGAETAQERVPALDAMLGGVSLERPIVIFFAFLVPLLAKWFPSDRRRWLAPLIVGLPLFMGMPRVAPGLPWLELLGGVLAFGASSWIYFTYGLLGVLSAAVGASMAAPLAWLAGSPWEHAGSLAASAGVYGAGLAVAAWLSRQGVPGEDAELAAEVARRNASVGQFDSHSEREFLLNEFAEAREAQMGMLPAQAPRIAGYSLAAACLPAREVGGDLYDVIEFRDGAWGLCVADVSGKGVPAALYMTMTKGVLASEQRVTSGPRELTLALNERLYEAGQRKIFVTMALARLDPGARHVDLIRAGHNPLLWRRARRRETVWLQPGGLGLGLAANRTFEKKLAVQGIDLEPGDTLLLYSDGLTEAENPRLELFGEERLEGIAARADDLPAEAFLQVLLEEVERFKEGADPHDDLTVLVLKAL